MVVICVQAKIKSKPRSISISGHNSQSHFHLFSYCEGSKMLCEFAIDKNETFLDSWLKNITWPTDDDETTSFKQIRTLTKNMMIVKLKINSPFVHMTVLDARSTLSDKIAKLGGTYGLWVQLTGCTLLVLVNVFVVAIKMGFKICR